MSKAVLFCHPTPMRYLIRRALCKVPLGSYELRYKIGALDRQNYAYLVFEAARLAHRLQKKAVSIIEFGVAGGNGLLALERHAEEVEKIFPIKIEIYGFDNGSGLPPPEDNRDLPYYWKPGFFRMDHEALSKKLKRAKLVIGNVKDTIPTFFEKYSPAPIGAVAQDLDFYSSTIATMALFERQPSFYLPRMFCYFDDVIGGNTDLYNDYTGERLAIHEFNGRSDERKLSPIYHLRAASYDIWQHQMWAMHLFDHPEYGSFVGDGGQQLPLG